MLTFGILWFFLFLAPTSSIVPITDLIFEHRLYLPLAGAAISVAAIFPLRPGMGKAFIFIFLLLSAVSGLATSLRLDVWKNNLTLWTDIVSKSPNKARPNNNLGNAYGSLGRYQEAIREFQAILRLKPDSAEAHYNLGVIYTLQKRFEDAVKE